MTPSLSRIIVIGSVFLLFVARAQAQTKQDKGGFTVRERYVWLASASLLLGSTSLGKMPAGGCTVPSTAPRSALAKGVASVAKDVSRFCAAPDVLFAGPS